MLEVVGLIQLTDIFLWPLALFARFFFTKFLRDSCCFKFVGNRFYKATSVFSLAISFRLSWNAWADSSIDIAQTILTVLVWHYLIICYDILEFRIRQLIFVIIGANVRQVVFDLILQVLKLLIVFSFDEVLGEGLLVKNTLRALDPYIVFLCDSFGFSHISSILEKLVYNNKIKI